MGTESASENALPDVPPSCAVVPEFEYPHYAHKPRSSCSTGLVFPAKHAIIKEKYGTEEYAWLSAYRFQALKPT